MDSDSPHAPALQGRALPELAPAASGPNRVLARSCLLVMLRWGWFVLGARPTSRWRRLRNERRRTLADEARGPLGVRQA